MNARRSLAALAALGAFVLLSAADLSGSEPRATARASSASPAPHSDPVGRALDSGVPLPDLVGTWAGTWADTVYSVSGPMTFDIGVSGSVVTASGTIDLSSIGFLQSIQLGNAIGSIVGNQLTFSFGADSVGAGGGAIIGDAISGSGTVVPPMSFGAFTFEGIATGDQLSGTFDFTSPTGGAGTALLTRSSAVEAEPWGSLKARWRASDRD